MANKDLEVDITLPDEKYTTSGGATPTPELFADGDVRNSSNVSDSPRNVPTRIARTFSETQLMTKQAMESLKKKGDIVLDRIPIKKQTAWGASGRGASPVSPMNEPIQIDKIEQDAW